MSNKENPLRVLLDSAPLDGIKDNLVRYVVELCDEQRTIALAGGNEEDNLSLSMWSLIRKAVQNGYVDMETSELMYNNHPKTFNPKEPTISFDFNKNLTPDNFILDIPANDNEGFPQDRILFTVSLDNKDAAFHSARSYTSKTALRNHQDIPLEVDSMTALARLNEFATKYASQ